MAPPATPRPRMLVHPGPVAPVRIDSRCIARGRHFRLALAPGRSLHDGIVDALHGAGVGNASMTLLDGDLASLVFCLAHADASGRVVATYGAPLSTRGARLVFGNATLGLSAAGGPVIHCHAAFRTRDGRVQGGHVLADRSVVGRSAVKVLATAIDGVDLRVGFDAETGMPLLRPERGARHG